MRKKALTLCAVVVAILGIIAALQYQANGRLRARIEAAPTRASLKPTRSPASTATPEAEEARLRATILASEAQLESKRNQASDPVADTDGPRPPAWKNSGQATPASAVETGLWAQATGDADLLAHSISFDSEGRAELLKMFSALAAEDRQYFGTPERMAAELISEMTDQSLTKDVNGFATSLVETATDGDAAEVLIRMTLPEKNIIKDAKVLSLRREADGWKVIIPAAEVTALKNALIISSQAIPPSQRALRGTH